MYAFMFGGGEGGGVLIRTHPHHQQGLLKPAGTAEILDGMSGKLYEMFLV